MIKVIGVKRTMILFSLIGLNGFFAAAVYGYMVPENIKLERNLRALRGEISTVQGDIDSLQVQFEQLEQQQAQYEALEKDGFFRSQGRREAQDLFERIQKSAKVVSAVANIESGAVEENEEAQKAAHKLLVSKVSLKIEALSDVDVYRYIYLLEKAFPGHISMDKIDLSRKHTLTAAVLRSIATGENVALVEANIDMTWSTMIPESQVIESEVLEGGTGEQ